MNKFRIVAILNLLFGLLQILSTILISYFVFPSTLEFYSDFADFGVSQPSFIYYYLALILIIFMAIINIFFAFSLSFSKNKTKKEKVFKWGIAFLVISFIATYSLYIFTIFPLTSAINSIEF